MPPPANSNRIEKRLYKVFLQIAPPKDIFVFYHTISSGSGALSTEILCPLTLKSLKGMQGVQRHCKNFWKILG